MGNKTPTGVSKDDSSFLLIDGLGPQTDVQFNPEHSSAVLAGVGQHLNMRQQHHDIPTCDRDAVLMYQTVTERLYIPKNNVTVLNSSRRSPYTATISNIEDSLKSAAKNVGKGGMLLFYFSGHVIGYEGGAKRALVPADYVEGKSQLLTVEQLATSLGSLKSTGSQIVIILDCCFAARVAKELNELLGSAGIRSCALAACSAVESSYSFSNLGASLFTFFMYDFLRRNAPCNPLSLKKISEYCSPVCSAMVGLMLREEVDGDGKLVNASMHPTVVFTELKLEVADERSEVRPIVDETDGTQSDGSPRFDKTLKLLQYHSEEAFTIDNDWSKEVYGWLQTNTFPKLEVLKTHDILQQKNVMETVCCLIMQSIAMLTITQRRELALKPNTPILNYFRVVEVVKEYEAAVMEDMDDHLVPAVQHYIKVLKQYLQTDEELRPLAGLYRTLTLDHQTSQHDEVDIGLSRSMAVESPFLDIIPRLPVAFEDLP